MKPSTEKMFSRIAERYDFMNHLMSFGLDTAWRKKLVRLANIKRGDYIADIATGTGDVVFEFARRRKDIRVVGMDISEAMLQVAQQKAEYAPVLDSKTGAYSASLEFQNGDALSLPFKDRSFDIVTMAFGIRNLPDYEKGLKEMIRVAKKGGKILILEFSLPADGFVRFFFRLYLKFVIPFFGGMFSERSAYEYLHRSIKEFAAVDVVQLMRSAGLQRVQRVPLSFGIVSLYTAAK